MSSEILYATTGTKDISYYLNYPDILVWKNLALMMRQFSETTNIFLLLTLHIQKHCKPISIRLDQMRYISTIDVKFIGPIYE